MIGFFSPDKLGEAIYVEATSKIPAIIVNNVIRIVQSFIIYTILSEYSVGVAGSTGGLIVFRFKKQQTFRGVEYVLDLH